MPLANLLDSIPFVLDAGDRNARFPNPPRNFRVQYPDGSIDIYSGGVWAALLTPGAASGGGGGGGGGGGTTPPPGTYLPPDIASHNFDDGDNGPFSAFSSGDPITFPVDPTGLLNGNVAQFRYARIGAPGGNEAAEATLSLQYARSFGQPMYFRGRVVLHPASMAGNFIRKLTYWIARNNYTKYPLSIGGVNSRTVLGVQGTDLVLDANWGPAIGSPLEDADTRTVQIVKSGMQGNTKYSIEIFQQMETALDLYNGKLQIWVDGVEVMNKQNMRWTDSGWVGARGNKDYNWSAVGNGVVMEAGDILFENWAVGNQVSSPDAFDELREWDDIAFSTTRIGP